MTPYDNPERGSWESGVAITKDEIVGEIKSSIADLYCVTFEEFKPQYSL